MLFCHLGKNIPIPFLQILPGKLLLSLKTQFRMIVFNNSFRLGQTKLNTSHLFPTHGTLSIINNMPTDCELLERTGQASFIFFFLFHLYLLQLFKAECDLSTTFPFTKLAPSYFSSSFTTCLSRLIILLL